MKILILGAGKMGRFFSDVLSFGHEVAIYDKFPHLLRFTFNALRFTDREEIRVFRPDLVINAVTLKYTLDAFSEILPFLPKHTILSDIASVKTGLPEFYAGCAHRYVSSHPMFGPTFASLNNLSNENAIIIQEGDTEGKEFFRNLYSSVHLHIEEYSFKQHDETIAYSLSIPFASSLVFGAVMRHQDAPGTTFKRHLAIAHGLMSEDDFLLSEILFNPHTPSQLSKIRESLAELQDIVERKDSDAMKAYLDRVRENLR